MVDLKFRYILPFSANKVEEFATIMDFLDAVENDKFSQTSSSKFLIEAIFFENPLSKKHFNSIQELYDHCVNITR